MHRIYCSKDKTHLMEYKYKDTPAKAGYYCQVCDRVELDKDILDLPDYELFIADQLKRRW